MNGLAIPKGRANTLSTLSTIRAIGKHCQYSILPRRISRDNWIVSVSFAPNSDPETPLLQTVFSPLAQAKNLAGGETLITHLRLYPESVTKGLATIAETTRRFVEACLDTGIDGIFYAIQHAQASQLTLEEYRTFGLPYDQKSLELAQDLWCNLLHLHGYDIYFSLVDSLKFPIVNWHDRETFPSLSEAQEFFDGVVCGGMRQDTLVYRNQAEVQKEAADALQQTGGKRFILGTGCVVPIIASHGNILAAREAPLSFQERGRG